MAEPSIRRMSMMAFIREIAGVTEPEKSRKMPEFLGNADPTAGNLSFPQGRLSAAPRPEPKREAGPAEDFDIEIG